MRIWHLVQNEYLHSVLSGIGAKIAGGRWNIKGVSVVYCASTVALCVLETLAHADRRRINKAYTAVEIEIPDNMLVLQIVPEDLPDDWRTYSAPPQLAIIGNQWVRTKKSCVLKAPSVLSPVDSNYILNTEHPEFNQIQIVNQIPYSFDERFVKFYNTI